MKYIITIRDTHIIDSQEESSELIVVGGFEYYDDGYKISYEETGEGYEGCSITLRYENDKKRVTMTRLGAVNSQMIMELDKRHICCYSTPVGEMIMGVYASVVDSKIEPHGGRLKLVYSLDIEGNYLSENFLDIIIDSN